MPRREAAEFIFMAEITIILPVSITLDHFSVVLAYFERNGRLSAVEWKAALKAFDLLGQATIAGQGKRQSFRQFYENEIDRRYADEFLGQIMAAETTDVAANALQQKVTVEIVANLESDGWYAEQIENSEYLAAQKCSA